MARSPLPTPPQPSSEKDDRALRIQVLATEHWSLLASRSTTQSEVLTRIAMFLTFVSASLLSLALVGNATGFGENFALFAVAILSVALVVGALTQLRVMNVSMEDLMYVLAMNRLRGEYARILPGIEDALMSSTHDDRAGSERTYYFLDPPRKLSPVLGSSMVFIIVVNAVLAGLLTATIVVIAGGVTVLTLVLAFVAAVAYFVVCLTLGSRPYFHLWRSFEPVSPSPQPKP
jgi:hypothetical protein